MYSDVQRLYNTYYKHLLDNPDYSKMPSEDQDVLSALFMLVNNYATNSILSLMNTILPALDLEFGEDLLIKLATQLSGEKPTADKTEYTVNQLATCKKAMIHNKIDKGTPFDSNCICYKSCLQA